MKKITLLLTGLILSLNLSWTGLAQAATISAASCSQSHVQAAIKLASSGDTVNIPAGSCTWTSGINIPDTTTITLMGAGNTGTIINVNMSSGSAISANYSKSRITGIGFIFTNSAGGIDIKGSGWRVDHCKFDNPAQTVTSTAVKATGIPSKSVEGLVDNCAFVNSRVVVLADLSLMANNVWAQPLGLGTASAVYVEDCTFDFTIFGNCMDANYGGAYVFRYNTVNDVYVEAHSVQGTHRATRKWEIYNNTFNQKNRTMWVPMFIRGGTGVIFNNILTGTWTNPNIVVDNVRSCYDRGEGGLCNGNSPWDGNESGQAGYPCRDQIGRSTDQWLWTSSNPYPPQVLDPAYAWNNKHGDNDVVFFQHSCAQSASHIQPNRDYYNNVKKPGYTPYTYPHPLRGSERETEPEKPAAPTGLKKIE